MLALGFLVAAAGLQEGLRAGQRLRHCPGRSGIGSEDHAAPTMDLCLVLRYSVALRWAGGLEDQRLLRRLLRSGLRAAPPEHGATL